MSEMEFSKDDKTLMVSKVKKYFTEELGQDIGAFDAEFLIDFFAGEIGPYFYNHGLNDAQQLFTEKVAELDYQVQELEKPTDQRS